MKKRFIFGTLIGTLMCAFALFVGVVANNVHNEPLVVYATETETEEKEATCFVTINECKNGSITVDKKSGMVGEMVTITVEHDMFYLIETVSVNGVSLIESEEVGGLFTFALVEGENLITATFVVDQTLLGELSIVYEQAKNKDWTNLFTVENIIRIVSWMLEGGILIAMVRYFVKDKKLAKNLEETVKQKIDEIIPTTTKETVEQTVNAVASPIFNNLQNELKALGEGISVLAECYALQQEGTPESKIAIIQNLKKINLGNQATIENVENYLKDLEDRMKKTYDEVLQKLNKIGVESSEEQKEDNENKVIF